MDLKSLLDLGAETLAVFKDHILILLAIIVVTFIAGSHWRRSIDDGEIRGLKAQKQAAEDRLQLAHDQNERVVVQVRTLEATQAEQDSVIAELRAGSANLKRADTHLDSDRLDYVLRDQINRLFSGNTEVRNLVTNLSTSTSDLGTTLTIVGPKGKTVIDPST